MSESILERRDVALVPSLAVGGVAMAAALSLLLRPASEQPDLRVVAACVAVGLLSAAAALSIERPAAQRLRRSPLAHLAAFALLTLGLGLVALTDGGLQSVLFTANVAAATYVGLVMPPRLAVAALAWMFAVAGAVAVLGPPPTVLVVVTVVLLILAGWGLGRLGNATHEQAARAASIASRSDTLTAMLNRRGFFEQLHFILGSASDTGTPVSLLALDLNGFKVINDRDGHAAGDAILRWIGEQLPVALPDAATVGRLGGDEFAIILPGSDLAAAELVAATVRATLAARIGVSIGAATAGPDGWLDADELVRLADDRMYVEKRGVPGARNRQGIARERKRAAPPGGPADLQTTRPQRSDRPAVSYSQAVEHHREQRAMTPERAAAERHIMNCSGAAAIVVCSVVFMLVTPPGDSWYDGMRRDAAVPWVFATLLLTLATTRWQTTDAFTGRWTANYLLSSILLGASLWVGMLAGEGSGIASPFAGAFFLKIIYDRFALSRTDARFSSGAICCWWIAAAVAGPSSALWVVPFALAMFAASWAVGHVAHRAHTDLTDEMLALASLDPVTGLSNRAGYDRDLAGAIARAPRTAGVLTVLGLDLDDFKRVNDERGHQAGDDLLRAVAAVLRRSLPDADSVGRVGGDEFVAVITTPNLDAARSLADLVTQELRTVAGASVGYAVLGVDGHDAETLNGAADTRAYAVKRTRQTRGTAPRPPRPALAS